MGLFESDHFEDEQCLALLRRTRLGRVSLSMQALPIIVPVRYILNDGELLFAVSNGELTKILHGNVAALQAEGFEEDSGRRWTVLAVGPVQRVSALEDLGSATISDLTPPGVPSVMSGDVYRLSPTIFSGRWIEAM